MEISRSRNRRRDKNTRQKTDTFIDFNDNAEGTYFCKKCRDLNMESELHPRIIRKGEVPPTDYHNWLQCYTCFELYPIYQVRHEHNLTGFREPLNNPLDTDAKFYSLGEEKRDGHIGNAKLDVRKDKDPEIDRLIRSGKNVQVHQ